MLPDEYSRDKAAWHRKWRAKRAKHQADADPRGAAREAKPERPDEDQPRASAPRKGAVGSDGL